MSVYVVEELATKSPMYWKETLSPSHTHTLVSEVIHVMIPIGDMLILYLLLLCAIENC